MGKAPAMAFNIETITNQHGLQGHPPQGSLEGRKQDTQQDRRQPHPSPDTGHRGSVHPPQGRNRRQGPFRTPAHHEIPSPRPCQGRTRHGQETGTRPDPPPSGRPERQLALAAVISRLLHPESKLATARTLSPARLTAGKCWPSWTGWSSASHGSGKAWPTGTSGMEPSCFTMSPAPIWRAPNVPLPPSAAIVTGRRGRNSWSSDFSAPRRAVPPPSPARSGSGSALGTLPWPVAGG